ncbi:MAG: hypothetical protein N2559_13545 [Anaerolineae bacterium]|nr:hypothetical protein [Anaerolineae bacterium]
MPFKFEKLEVWQLRDAYKRAETLVAKLHTLRKTIATEQKWLREESAVYEAE